MFVLILHKMQSFSVYSFVLAFFIQQNFCEIHACCCLYQLFVPFCFWMVLSIAWMCHHHFTLPLVDGGGVGGPPTTGGHYE